MRKLSILLVLAAALAFAACSGDGTGSRSSDDGEATGDDTATGDGTDGTTDDTTDTTGTDTGEIEIPDCQFSPPIGAKCNPYPNCPGTGCPAGQICTVTTQGDIKRIECDAPGGQPLGATCDYEAGDRCEEGLCVEGQCRGFCVDNPDCTNNAPCTQLSGVPGKPTVCGSAQSDCDPLDAENSCPPGLACYLQQNTGLTDCLETKQAGQQSNECDCTNCCAPGLACVTQEGTQLCGAVCVQEGEGALLCSELCGSQQLATKQLDNGLGACVPPADDPDPPPDPIPCNALAQDCEGAAQGCYPTNKGDQCLAKGNKAAGADCQNVNECAPGSYCHGSGKCFLMCDPADPQHPECETGLQAQCPQISGSAAGYCDE